MPSLVSAWIARCLPDERLLISLAGAGPCGPGVTTAQWCNKVAPFDSSEPAPMSTTSDPRAEENCLDWEAPECCRAGWERATVVRPSDAAEADASERRRWRCLQRSGDQRLFARVVLRLHRGGGPWLVRVGSALEMPAPGACLARTAGLVGAIAPWPSRSAARVHMHSSLRIAEACLASYPVPIRAASWPFTDLRGSAQAPATSVAAAGFRTIATGALCSTAACRGNRLFCQPGLAPGRGPRRLSGGTPTVRRLNRGNRLLIYWSRHLGVAFLHQGDSIVPARSM